MSTTAIPQIPPRPTRSQEPPSTKNGSTLGSEIPKIPPRPINRRIERSMSPHRDRFASSPLNEPTFVAKIGKNGSPTQSIDNANGRSDLPVRPSTVTLPSIGQEGNEYAEIFTSSADEADDAATQTRNIAQDLKLHAPKPSMPASSAKERVSTVTRTDSSQIAALGLGKKIDDKIPGDDKEFSGSRSLKSKASFTSQHSATDRPSSVTSPETDGPDSGDSTGVRVPMYPNAGFVQAPSPASNATQYPIGIGYHNDGTKQRHHGRRTSARGVDNPPGSYGMHGHGVMPKDRFEQAYYEKRPELLKKEVGTFNEDRKEWALSSDDLNKIVRETASRGTRLGISAGIIGTPTEQIAFLAHEEYTSRMSSPRPQSAAFHSKASSNASEVLAESTSRKESIQDDKAELAKSLGRSSQGAPEIALESEFEDDDVVHVDEPGRRVSAIYGGSKHSESTENLGPSGGNTPDAGGFIVESGYGVPILASDEVAKEPFGYELQPAVSPQEHRHTDYDNEQLAQFRASQSSLPGSRPSSRPGSINGGVSNARYQPEFDREPRSTPLEDLAEYEPLFPEDEKNHPSKAKPVTHTDKLKSRPELKGRKFPSQDIWEDTPDSHMYTATVSTPQLPDEPEEDNVMDNLHIRNGDTPERAFARRQEELAQAESKDSESFLKQQRKPWEAKSHLVAESRPVMKQRFPSRDIWEDTPDSLQLETTVASPQIDEKDQTPVPEERPTIGAVVYHEEEQDAGLELGDEEGRATTGIAATIKPSIPPRPSKLKPVEAAMPEDKAEATPTSATLESPPILKTIPPLGPKPPVPERSKPQIPTRPVRKDSSEGTPLSKTPSASSAKSTTSDNGTSSAAAAKPKPPVPSRPLGSKIAALQGGFMSDLNKRLQFGPMAPKKEQPKVEEPEEEKEKAPLADARKGRARGPARRTPAAKSPAPAATVETVEKAATLGFSAPATLWEISPEDGELELNSSEAEPESETKEPEVPKKPSLETEVVKAMAAAPEDVDDDISPSTVVAPETELQESIKEIMEENKNEEVEEEEVGKEAMTGIKPSAGDEVVEEGAENKEGMEKE